MGYTLPNSLTKKLHIEKLRVYFTGQNLFEFTPLTDAYDPEGLAHDPDAGEKCRYWYCLSNTTHLLFWY